MIETQWCGRCFPAIVLCCVWERNFTAPFVNKENFYLESYDWYTIIHSQQVDYRWEKLGPRLGSEKKKLKMDKFFYENLQEKSLKCSSMFPKMTYYQEME